MFDIRGITQSQYYNDDNDNNVMHARVGLNSLVNYFKSKPNDKYSLKWEFSSELGVHKANY
jgi:hypothetical protein